MNSANGKLDKKEVFSACCGDKTTTCYARPFKNMPERTPYAQPPHQSNVLGRWRDCGNILITPNDKGTYKRRCRSMRLFHLHRAVKIQPFYPVFFINGIHTKISCWVIPLKFQGIKHQPFPMAQPYKNPAAAPGDPRHSPISSKKCRPFPAWDGGFDKTKSLGKRRDCGNILTHLTTRPHTKGSVTVCSCFISTARWKCSLFIQFFH